MGFESGLMGDLKRQASLFLKDKILKRARLVLMYATPAQLLTEEIINGDSCAQDASAMRIISRAAFEVDDYERIVHILNHRLSKFETWNWRASYNALVVLEYLLTHGPLRVAEEFQSDQQTITHMATLHYVDHKGFDWGLTVKEKSDRTTRLLEDKSYLAEERAKARKLSMGIKGFGSFNIDVGSLSSKPTISNDHCRHNSQKTLNSMDTKPSSCRMAAMNILWKRIIHFGIIKSHTVLEFHFYRPYNSGNIIMHFFILKFLAES